jgi:hypothetical protein
MFKLRLLMGLFLFFIVAAFVLSNYTIVAATMLLLSAIVVAIGLFHFLSEMKIKRLGKIKIEEVAFVRNFVFRAYTIPKKLWVVYDKGMKSFREADFRDMPLKAGLTFLIGLILLYVSYLILSTINQALELLPFRITVLILFLTLGFYNFFVSLARFYCIGSKESPKTCKLLNKNRALIRIIEREKLSFEITPNFLLWNGFVTSIEFVSQKRVETKAIEKDLVQIAKLVEKIK